MQGAWLLVSAAGLGAPVQADDKDRPCLECHGALVGKAVVHAALDMGCATCHGDLEASSLPHRSSGKRSAVPAAEGRELCIPCHERSLFEGQVIHGPVAAGTCLGCHDPHASAHQGLLKREPVKLCLECHAEIARRPHVVAGLTRSGHPLGGEKPSVSDPLRPGRSYYCAACHEPHRSRLPRLTRFEKGMASCQKCHKV